MMSAGNAGMVKLLRLRGWRVRKAFSQRELAAKAGISRVALIRIEQGQAEPHPKTTRALARVLGVKPEELMESPDGGD